MSTEKRAFDQMIFIPLGMRCGAPISAGYYIWKSMIPTLLGNFVGGGLFVSTVYWYLYLTGEGNIQVDFNIAPLNSVMEAGGPMRRTRVDQELDNHAGSAIAKESSAFPQPSNQLASAIGRELSDDSPYAKSHAERTKSPDTSSDEKA